MEESPSGAGSHKRTRPVEAAGAADAQTRPPRLGKHCAFSPSFHRALPHHKHTQRKTRKSTGHWASWSPFSQFRTHMNFRRAINWPEYERALIRRGDITLWLSADAIAAWTPAPSGRRGGQRKFSDHGIETALTLRLVFGLPLRQAEGFLRSVLSLMNVDLEAPDHTTLSRRSQHLNVRCHLVPPDGPLHLIVDSTGLSIVGEGEWAAVKHGGRGTRGWKKLHFGVDGSGAIVAHVLTAGERRRRDDRAHADRCG